MGGIFGAFLMAFKAVISGALADLLSTIGSAFGVLFGG